MTATATEPEQAVTKRNDVSVKMDSAVVGKCRIAAAYKGLSLAEYLSASMLAIATGDIEEEHSRLDQPPKPAPKKKGAGK